MAWQSFVLALAPYVVALAGLVLAAFSGREALAAKDAQLAAKDEQLATLRLMAPERVVENVRALHAYYKEEVELTKAKLDAATKQLAAAGTERQDLSDEVNRLRERLKIFDFGIASTASAFLTTATLSPASLTALLETVSAASPARDSSLWNAFTATTLLNPPGKPARKRKSKDVTKPAADPQPDVPEADS